MRRRPFPAPGTTSAAILSTARRLAGARETFSLEDLAVECWRDWPLMFGLAGYRDRYPDINRVEPKVYGATGMVARGWLAWVGTRVLRVPSRGKRAA